MKQANIFFGSGRFRWLGLTFIIIAFFEPIILNFFNLLPEYSNWKQDVSKIFFIIGLMFIAFSSGKMEDEFIARARLNAMMRAVILSIVLYLGNTIIPLFNFKSFSYSGFEVLTIQLLSFLLFFYTRSRGLVPND